MTHLRYTALLFVKLGEVYNVYVDGLVSRVLLVAASS